MYLRENLQFLGAKVNRKPDFFNERYDKDLLDDLVNKANEIKQMSDDRTFKKTIVGDDENRIKTKIERKEKPTNFNERLQMEVVEQTRKGGPLQREGGNYRKGSPIDRDSSPRKGSPVDREPGPGRNSPLDRKPEEKQEFKRPRRSSDKLPDRLIASNDLEWDTEKETLGEVVEKKKRQEELDSMAGDINEKVNKPKKKNYDEDYEKWLERQYEKEETEKVIKKKFLGSPKNYKSS